MLWWPLFFITLLIAQEDPAVEKYCFSSSTGREKAYAQFSAISVSSDKTAMEGNCFTVTARPHRRELIQKYLLSRNPDMSISFPSEIIRKDPCELKVEKISSIGADETYHITTLKDFELALSQDKIIGECRYISPQRYEVTITLQKGTKPAQIQLNRGNRVEIESIIQNMKSKDHSAQGETFLSIN